MRKHDEARDSEAPPQVRGWLRVVSGLISAGALWGGIAVAAATRFSLIGWLCLLFMLLWVSLFGFYAVAGRDPFPRRERPGDVAYPEDESRHEQ